MTADLVVAFDCHGPLFKVHTFQEGIFPEFLLNIQDSLLKLPFPFQFLFFQFPLLLKSLVITLVTDVPSGIINM